MQLYFYYSNEMDEDEDYKIKVCSDSKIPIQTIKDLVLDVFDMNLNEFDELMSNYNFINDIIEPDSPKPYLIQDRLEDVILI